MTASKTLPSRRGVQKDQRQNFKTKQKPEFSNQPFPLREESEPEVESSFEEPLFVAPIKKFMRQKSKIQKNSIRNMTLIEYQLSQRLANKNAEYVQLEEQHRLTMNEIRMCHRLHIEKLLTIEQPIMNIEIEPAQKEDFNCQTSFIEQFDNEKLPDEAIREAELSLASIEDRHNEMTDEDLFDDEEEENKQDLLLDVQADEKFEKDEENLLSYVNLKSSLAQTHPANQQNISFSIWQQLGGFPIFLNVDKNGKSFIPITEQNMEIGLGPSLMLSTVKSLAILFFILSIASIPLFLSFNQSRQHEKGLTTENLSLPNIFFMLSIGNLGQDQIECVKTYKENGKFLPLDIKCSYGTISHIDSISITHDSKPCLTLTPQEQQKQTKKANKCFPYQNNIFESSNLAQLKTDFDLKCKQNSSCQLEVPQKLSLDVGCSKNANMTVSVQCIQKFFEINLDILNDTKLSKQDFASFLILFDFIIIIILVAFGIWLERRQNQFIEAFKEQAVQMDHYTIKVSSLPPIDWFKGDEHVLKAKLLMHFHDLFMSKIELDWNATMEQHLEQIKEQPQVKVLDEHQEDLKDEVKERMKLMNPFDYSLIGIEHLPMTETEFKIFEQIGGDKYYGNLDLQTQFKHGKGYQVFADGSLYEGCWQMNKQHGFGRMIYTDGSVYQGYWRNDTHHGRGAYLWFEEKQIYKYKGNFKFGNRGGKGTLVFPEGEMLAGIWVNGKISGRFTFCNKSRTQTGYFNFRPKFMSENQFNRIKAYLHPMEMWAYKTFEIQTQFNQNSHLVLGTYNGFGVIRTPRGDAFEGCLDNHNPNGVGTYFNSENIGRKCLWRQGIFICWLDREDKTNHETIEIQKEKLIESKFFETDTVIDGMNKEKFCEMKMRDYEIVDISFGKTATKDVKQLLKIFPIYKDIVRQNQYKDEQSKLLSKTTDLYREFIQMQKSKFGQLANMYSDMLEKEADHVQTWNPPKYAFVTFRKTSAREQAELLYKIGFLQSLQLFLGKFLKVEWIRRRILPRQNENLKVGQQFSIEVSNGGIPIEIKWLNIKYDFFNRVKRKMLVIGLSTFCIFFGIAVLILFQNLSDGATADETFCRSSASPADEENSQDSDNRDFVILVLGFVINGINEGLKEIFKVLQDYEKNHSESEDTKSLFVKNSIMQFVNIAVMQLVLGFRLESYTESCFLGFIPVFRGKHDDFSTQWYRDVGATLGVTLFFNIIGSHLQQLLRFLLAFFLRCYDRGCRYSSFIKKKKSADWKAQQDQLRKSLQKIDTIRQSMDHPKQIYDTKLEDERLFKVLVVGDSGVGKTQFIMQLLEGTSNEIKVKENIRSKRMQINGQQVNMQVIEQVGLLRSRQIDDIDSLLVIYDITNLDSFKHAKKWMEQINKYRSETSTLLLVGNKTDLAKHRQVKYSQGKQLADMNYSGFYETSVIQAPSSIAYLSNAALNESQKESFEINLTHSVDMAHKQRHQSTETIQIQNKDQQQNNLTNNSQAQVTVGVESKEVHDEDRSSEQSKDQSNDELEKTVELKGNDKEVEEGSHHNQHIIFEPVYKINNPISIQIMVVGANGVGKSTFINHIQDVPFENSEPLGQKGLQGQYDVEIDGNQLEILIQEQDINMRLKPNWELGLGIDGVIVLFDVTNAESFNECIESISHYLKQPDQRLGFILIGTHCDKEETRKVKYEEAVRFAAENQMKYFEVGHKDSAAAKEAIEYLAQQLLQTNLDEEIPKTKRETLINLNAYSKSKIRNTLPKPSYTQFPGFGLRKQTIQLNYNRQSDNDTEQFSVKDKSDINKKMSGRKCDEESRIDTKIKEVIEKVRPINKKIRQVKEFPFEVEEVVSKHQVSQIEVNQSMEEEHDDRQLDDENQVSTQQDDKKEEGPQSDEKNQDDPDKDDQKQDDFEDQNDETKDISVQNPKQKMPIKQLIKLKLVGLLWKFVARKKRATPNDECDLRTKKAIQEDVISLYTGIEMQSHEVYSEIISTYWCIIMFSSGIPALYIVGFLFYFCFYWIYKALILNYFKKATRFNQEVAIRATNMIHIAVVWHIMIASVMLSNTKIFGSESDSDLNFFFSLVSKFKRMASRFTTHYSLNYIGWNLIFLIIYIVAIIFVKSLSGMYQIYTECKTNNKKRSLDEDQKVDNSGFYKDLSFAELRNLNRRVRQERKQAELYMRAFEKDILKNEYLRGHFNKLLPEKERKYYLKWLKTRQNSINGIITYHYMDLINFLKRIYQQMVRNRLSKVNLVKGVDQQREETESRRKENKIRRMIEEMEQLIDPWDETEFEGGQNKGKTPEKTTSNNLTSEKLIIKFLEIVNRLRLMRINYTNKKCFMLRDVIQSFNMYDSPVLKNAKEVKDFLESEFGKMGKPLKSTSAKRYIRYNQHEKLPEVPPEFVESKQDNQLTEWIDQQAAGDLQVDINI